MEEALINLIIAVGGAVGSRVKPSVADQELTYPYAVIERIDTDFQSYIGGAGGPSIATFQIRVHSKTSAKTTYDAAIEIRDDLWGYSGTQDSIEVRHILPIEQRATYRHDKAGREFGTWATAIDYEVAYEEL